MVLQSRAIQDLQTKLAEVIYAALLANSSQSKTRKSMAESYHKGRQNQEALQPDYKHEHEALHAARAANNAQMDD